MWANIDTIYVQSIKMIHSKIKNRGKHVKPSHKFRKIYIYMLIIICVVFLILKLTFLDNNVVWDESVYLGMGKYIYSGGNSGLWEMIRPLGLPLVTGAFWKIGFDGADQVIACRILSIIISIGCIIVTFLITKELFNNKHALLSALILACTPIFFFYSNYILTDHISTLLLMLSILFLIKDKFMIGGVFGGLSFWFKFTNVLFIFALVLFLAYRLISRVNTNSIITSDRKDKKTIYTKHNKKYGTKKYFEENKKYLYALAIIILFVATYFGANYFIYRQHLNPFDATFKPYLDAAVYSSNPYQSTSFDSFRSFLYYIFYYPYNIIFNDTFGFLVYTFLLIYFVKLSSILKKSETKESHILIMFVFFTYIIHFSIISYKNDRFWMTFLPFMAIYAAYGIFTTYERFQEIFKDRLKSAPAIKIARYTGITLLSIIILITFALAIHKDVKIYEQNKINTEYYLSEQYASTRTTVEKYFDVNHIDGPILVTNPFFSAYSDKRYIGAYDVLNKDGMFVNMWESDMKFNAVAYIDSSISCNTKDFRCIENKNKLKAMIEKEFRETDSYMYNGANVTFYIRK